MRERPRAGCRDRHTCARFNPRPREGATVVEKPEPLAFVVSIRAPVRERHSNAGRPGSDDGFNPRPREGATDAATNPHHQAGVSIRAPVRERPSAVHFFQHWWRSFNPRPREGATPPTYNLLAGNVKDAGLREPEPPMLRGRLAVGAWPEKSYDIKERGPLRTVPGLRGPLGFARPACCGSDDERTIEIGRGFGAVMLDAAFPVGPQHVEPQAVLADVELGQKPGAQACPLCRIDLAFEHRELHTLAKILTGPSDPAQAPTAGRTLGIDIVSYENQHRYLQT